MKAQPNWPCFDSVKIWPVVGLGAIRTNLGGPFRLWSIARHLDNKGSEVVVMHMLKDYCDSLGINQRTYLRWQSDAKDYGIITLRYWSKSEQSVISLKKLASAAKIFECQRIGYPVIIPTYLLLNYGWRGWVWAAYLATLGERPISRGKMREITGVPEQTQRDYENQIGIQKIENYAVTDLSADHLSGMGEFERSYAFLFRDAKTPDPVIAYQLPNTYIPPKVVRTSTKGRSRKAQKQLNAASFYVERDHSVEIVRLYHSSERSAVAAIRKHGRLNGENHTIPVYKKRFEGSSTTWEEMLD